MPVQAQLWSLSSSHLLHLTLANILLKFLHYTWYNALHSSHTPSMDVKEGVRVISTRNVLSAVRPVPGDVLNGSEKQTPDAGALRTLRCARETSKLGWGWGFFPAIYLLLAELVKACFSSFELSAKFKCRAVRWVVCGDLGVTGRKKHKL